MSLVSRQIETLDQDAVEGLKTFIPQLLDNIRDLENKIETRIALLVVLIFIAELIFPATVSEMSILGLKISDYSAVEKLAPAGLAFIFFTLVTLVAGKRILIEALGATIEKSHPKIYKSKFADHVTPSSLFKIYQMLERDTRC